MKLFTFNGKTTDHLPDPLKLMDGSTVSPITEARFVQLGGTITDDGQPGPKEAVISSLNSLLHELENEVDGVTVAEFKQAAQSMHSGELVGYARQQGVSEEVIASARIRIMEIMADALREGMTWPELIGGITP